MNQILRQILNILYGFSRKAFFREVRDTNVDSESFVKFDSTHFEIQIDHYRKKFVIEFLDRTLKRKKIFF